VQMHIFSLYEKEVVPFGARPSAKNAKYGKSLKKDDPEICEQVVEKCKCTYSAYMKRRCTAVPSTVVPSRPMTLMTLKGGSRPMALMTLKGGPRPMVLMTLKGVPLGWFRQVQLSSLCYNYPSMGCSELGGWHVCVLSLTHSARSRLNPSDGFKYIGIDGTKRLIRKERL
jgi:hypothetical protein